MRKLRKNIYNQLRNYVENLDEQDRLLVFFRTWFYDSYSRSVTGSPPMHKTGG
jgi:hypothetical protein